MAVRGIEEGVIRRDSLLRNIAIALSFIGVIDSAYLTWIKLSHQESRCIVGLGDCFSVNTSRFSSISGVPVALIGLIGYLLILVLLLIETRNEEWRSNISLAVFGLTFFGTLFSAYLTYLEIAVIRAICPYCVVSASIMLILFVISIVRLTMPASEAQSIN